MATVNTVAREIRRRLREEADPVRRAREHRYFKETVRNVGVTVPRSTAIGRDAYRAHATDLSRDEWLALCERLLADGWLEEGHAALEIAGRLRLPPTKETFDRYERWLSRYVGNWAHCDELCGALIGPLLAEQPRLVRRVVAWTRSNNRWRRRGAAVSLTWPAKRGLFLSEALAIAEALLDEKDDLVQKATGWMLREAAKAHPAEVTALLERHAPRLPRTAFRYAIERFPPEERKRLMAL